MGTFDVHERRKVILVNEQDEPIGLMLKWKHTKAVLHRAFSVLFQSKRELMLTTGLHKYHSPGLWTNTCCSHQRHGESNLAAGKRRLQEEMGFEVPLEELFSLFIKPFDNGLTEHELDQCYGGL